MKEEKKGKNVNIGNKPKRTKLILPLIVLLALICVIAIVWAGFARPNEIAQIDRDAVDTKEEEILAAEAKDIAATTVGTKVKATFTASTGEVVIYGTDASTQGTIKNSGESSLNTFWGKCGAGNIKIITFRDRVYAPENSSYLFVHGTANSSAIEINYLRSLTTINNAGNLDTSKVTDMVSMFCNCSSLKTVDVSNWNTSNVVTIYNMFERM